MRKPRVLAVEPTLAFRDFQLLKLKYDELLSNFAFNCNLRPSIKGDGISLDIIDKIPGGAVQVDPMLTPS